jgi:hypothetical protein
MTLDEVRRALDDRRLMAVATATRLSYYTVWRVHRGQTKAVSYEVIKRLSDYLTISGVEQ